MKKLISISIMIVAIGCLVPGVTQPFFSLTGTVDKAALIELGVDSLVSEPTVPAFMVSIAQQLVGQLEVSGELPAFEKTRSIVGTVKELYQADQVLVAMLIALFSIFVPVLKCLLMLVTALVKQTRIIQVSEQIKMAISKWSMADVFVVAIIVAYLAANATQHTDELFLLDAKMMPGFYYFLSYCMLSILSAQLLDQSANSNKIKNPDPINTVE